MLNQILKIFKRGYTTLNLIEISKQNLLDNYQYLSKPDKNLKIAPVIKSNAYGHGIQLVAKIFDEVKAPFFCVDSLYEAYELQKVEIKTPILVMGYTNPENFKIKKLPFQFAVYDLETVEILNEYQPGAKIHLFIDTGLNREGISLHDLEDFSFKTKQFPNITTEGMMSHLSSSQTDKDPLFLNQVKNFQKAQEILKNHGIKPKYVHLAASGAITNPKTRSIIAKVSNLTRVGISLYGFSDTDDNLKPALTLTTKLAQIKTIKKGDRVGYDGTFTAKKDMRIGILPIGYNDGIDRRLSNKGYVTVSNTNCKILGRVSMNITTIDLTNVPNAQKGDTVVVFSSNSIDPNSIQNTADICKTIPYELLIHLDSSIKRKII